MLALRKSRQLTLVQRLQQRYGFRERRAGVFDERDAYAVHTGPLAGLRDLAQDFLVAVAIPSEHEDLFLGDARILQHQPRDHSVGVAEEDSAHLLVASERELHFLADRHRADT